MDNQIISVKITDNITVEWRPSYYRKEYIKNEKYASLVHHGWHTHQSIFDLDKLTFMDQYVIRGTYSGPDGKINHAYGRIKNFNSEKIPLIEELNMDAPKYKAWLLSGFLRCTNISSPFYVNKVNHISFDDFKGADLAEFDINIVRGNELIHNILIPEILKVILATNFTEDIVLKHIKNYPSLPRHKTKLFKVVEAEKGLIKMVKTTKGKKEMQNFIFSTRDPELIQKVISEYKLDPDTVMEKSLKINDGALIEAMYDLTSKKNREKYNEEIIRRMHVLINTQISRQFLEKLPDMQWGMYGPDTEIGMYHCKTSLPECLDITSPPEIVRFVTEKIPGKLSAGWMRDFTSRFIKKNTELTPEFFEIMEIFGKSELN
jgi:hypothetical protein